MQQNQGWTPEYVANMPFDQLIAWSRGSSTEVSREEALGRG